MRTPFKPSMGGFSSSTIPDADVSMEADDIPVETMLSSPPRAPRSISRARNKGGSLAHRLFADDDEDDQDYKRSPVLKPLDLNLDLNDVTDGSANPSGSLKERKRHAEQTLDGRDVSFDDVESPVDMHESPRISPSCYKSPAHPRCNTHKSPSSFRTLDGRMVTSKNPFSPMLMEDRTPTRAPPPIGDALTFPVSLDDGSKKTINDEGSLPVIRHRLQKRETGREFVRDGYPAKSGEFRGFSGSPIHEMEISGNCGYNNHKVRRINIDDDVVAAASHEETAKASWKKKLQIKTKQSYYNGCHDDISPTDVMSFSMMSSPGSPSSAVPPTPTKPRHYRRPAVKRYTPVRNNARPPNTPVPQRRARARSFDSEDEDDDKKLSSDSPSPSNRQMQSRFHSDFDVIGELGTGSFGNVLKVLSRLDGCMYAIKVAHRPAKGTADKDRMLKEVYALAALSDQADTATFHIVRYHQAWMEENRLYIQTELCTSTLAAEMNQAELTPQRKYKFLREICVALEFIHKNGMVHLDIKPENIFIKNDQFKLGDFGLVTKVSNHQDVEEGDSRYMSMELLSGDHDDLTKSDIFSLGITFYELCLGGRELPTNGPEWQALRSGNIPLIPKTPVEMQNFINIMMNPSYSSRPAPGDLLKRPQLLSDEQKELLIERNKVIQANLALAEQTNRLRRLAPAPSMPRKGLLVRANTWNGN